MKNKHILKTSFQIYSIAVGIIGLFFIYLAGTLTLGAFASKEYMLLLLNIFVLSISGILIFISYETIFKFSEKSIINLSAITGVLVYLATNLLFDNFQINTKMANIKIQQFLFKVGPFILGYLAYRSMRFISLKVARTNNLFQPVNSTDPKGRAAD